MTKHSCRVTANTKSFNCGLTIVEYPEVYTCSRRYHHTFIHIPNIFRLSEKQFVFEGEISMKLVISGNLMMELYDLTMEQLHHKACIGRALHHTLGFIHVIAPIDFNLNRFTTG